jgi:hypothetical protein
MNKIEKRNNKLISDIVFVINVVSVMGVMLISNNVLATESSQKDTVYNESVIVNVGFNPIVSDANKIVENPTIFDTSFSQINLSFEKIDKGYTTQLAFDTIKAAQVKGEPVARLYNFNIKGGLGMAFSKKLGNGFTPLLQASYTSLRDRHLIYGADVYFRNIIGKTKDYGYGGYSNGDINLWAKKIMDNYALTSRVYYNYNRHYYYGTSPYLAFDSVLKDAQKKDYRVTYHNLGLDLAMTKLQRDNSFQTNSYFTLNYTSSKLKSRELDLHLLLDFSKNLHLFGATEQTLGLSFDYRHAFRFYKGTFLDTIMNVPLGNYFINDVSVLYANNADDIESYSKSRALFNFSPYFIFDYKKFHFFTSLAFVPKINGYNDFQILPTATISFEVIQNILSFYGGFKSEAKLPTLYDLVSDNPFLAPSIRLQDEANENLFIKLITTISPSAQITLEGGITEMKNYHFYYNTLAYNTPICNTMTIDYANAKRYYATFETHFNLSSSFFCNLEATYQQITRDDDLTAYYCPKFYTTLDLTYKYADKLLVSVAPTFKTKQKAKYLDTEYKIKPTINVALDVTYNYTNNWSFFLTAENLSFQNYNYYYGYPVYSFIALVGAKYRF